MTLSPERCKALILSRKPDVKLSLFAEGVALPLVDTVDFRLPLAKRNYGKQRLFYQSAKEWNILDASFKEINSLLLFKQSIKSYIF